jgi:hypothetical protein
VFRGAERQNILPCALRNHNPFMKYAFVLCLLFVCFTSYSQKVYNLKKSYTITVYLTERKEVEGIFHSLTDSTIAVMSEKSYAINTILIDSIYKLEFRKYNRAKTGTLAGAAIGFIAGFAIGQVEYDEPGVSDSYQLGRSGGSGLLGGFIGALVGGVVGKLSKNYLILGNPQIYHQFKNELMNYQLEQP